MKVKNKLVRTATDNDEGKFVADIIQEQKLRNHFRNSDFAILYRTNAQAGAMKKPEAHEYCLPHLWRH